MVSKYYVLDVETTVNNTSPDKKNCGLASPFHEDNRIVASGIKTADVVAPVLFYEREIGRYSTKSDIGSTLTEESSKSFIESASKCPMIVGHNIAFDVNYILRNATANNQINILKQGIIDNKVVLWDTMLVEYILSGQSWKYPSLDDVCKKYKLPVKNDEVKTLWDSGVKTEDIPQDILLPYLEHDVEVTEKIFLKQLKEVNEKGLKSVVFDELRARMATIIAEHNGMAFDEDHALSLHKKLDVDILDMEIELVEILFKHNKITKYSKEFEDSINFASHDQISYMLFGGTIKWKECRIMEDKDGGIMVYKHGKNKGAIKYKNTEFTKELKGMATARKEWKSKKLGVFYTSDEVLNEVKWTCGTTASSFIKLIQKHREARKERDTYLTGLTKVCWQDGLLHPTFNHVETPTGRLSCRNPNLQNITAKR